MSWLPDNLAWDWIGDAGFFCHDLALAEKYRHNEAVYREHPASSTRARSELQVLYTCSLCSDEMELMPRRLLLPDLRSRLRGQQDSSEEVSGDSWVTLSVTSH